MLVVAAGEAAARQLRSEWAILALCVAGVLAASFSIALESMAKSITDRHDANLRDRARYRRRGRACSASIGAAAAGTILFAHRLGLLLGRSVITKLGPLGGRSGM